MVSHVIALLGDIFSAYRPPIYIVGMARSGTTWVASILNTARGIKYFYEPFNYINVSGVEAYTLKYFRRDDAVPGFRKYYLDTITGRISKGSVISRLSAHYRKYRYWPGRILIKDVHTCMSLDWIHQHITPKIVIVMRHPCAVATSWLRLNYDIDSQLKLLLLQRNLFLDFLGPFESLLRNANSFCEKMGAYWGAMYYVMLQQQQTHPDWILVKHEELCMNPKTQFRKLFVQLNLDWTLLTDERLRVSSARNSADPYLPERISSEEGSKWRNELDSLKIEEIKTFVSPYGILGGKDFET